MNFQDVASFNDVNELVEFVSLRSNLFDVEETEERGGQKTVLFIANRSYPDRFEFSIFNISFAFIDILKYRKLKYMLVSNLCTKNYD